MQHGVAPAAFCPSDVLCTAPMVPQPVLHTGSGAAPPPHPLLSSTSFLFTSLCPGARSLLPFCFGRRVQESSVAAQEPAWPCAPADSPCHHPEGKQRGTKSQFEPGMNQTTLECAGDSTSHQSPQVRVPV